MTPADLNGILTFLKQAEALKHTLRSGFLSDGRAESTAEHSWRLCLMAMLVSQGYPNIDTLKLIKICLVHDLGEAIGGDIPAIHQVPGQNKAADERADLLTLTAPLPEAMREEIVALWDEYEAAATPEAKLAKALDKIETCLQHTQGKNPDNFDYGFNLGYGQHYTQLDETTRALRTAIDADTERLAKANGTMPA